MENKNMELWKDLKKNNPSNLEEIAKSMKSCGYSKGEIQTLLGIKKLTDKKSRADQLKEDIYIRHQLRIRLLMDHIEKQNLLSVLNSSREEEKHIIESLTKLGELSPTNTNSGEAMGLRLETFIYKSKEDQPILPLRLQEDDKPDS